MRIVYHSSMWSSSICICKFFAIPLKLVSIKEVLDEWLDLVERIDSQFFKLKSNYEKVLTKVLYVILCQYTGLSKRTWHMKNCIRIALYRTFDEHLLPPVLVFSLFKQLRLHLTVFKFFVS